MKKARVLHIVDSLGLGGAQTLLKGIFEFKKDYKNIFLFSLREKEIKVDIDHKNILGFKSTSKYSLKPLRELRNLIEEEKIEILHCHLLRSIVFGYVLKIFFFPNIKLIIHEHGRIYTDNVLYNLFLGFAQKRIDFFLAVSKETKKQLIEKAKIKKEKIKILYNFVDLERFNKKNITWDIEKEKEKLGIKKDEFVIGFAGRLVERKGWREFVEAGDLLKEKEFKFLIAGDGKDKGELINFIKENNLEKRVLFLGYVSDMVWFYSLLDCFVISSHWEPMGLTEIEAQALHISVISSNVPALNEIIVHEENGLLFEGRDSKDLALKIEMMKDDVVLRERLIQNSLDGINIYSLADYIKNLEDMYYG